MHIKQGEYSLNYWEVSLRHIFQGQAKAIHARKEHLPWGHAVLPSIRRCLPLSSSHRQHLLVPDVTGEITSSIMSLNEMYLRRLMYWERLKGVLSRVVATDDRLLSPVVRVVAGMAVLQQELYQGNIVRSSSWPVKRIRQKSNVSRQPSSATVTLNLRSMSYQ